MPAPARSLFLLACDPSCRSPGWRLPGQRNRAAIVQQARPASADDQVCLLLSFSFSLPLSSPARVPSPSSFPPCPVSCPLSPVCLRRDLRLLCRHCPRWPKRRGLRGLEVCVRVSGLDGRWWGRQLVSMQPNAEPQSSQRRPSQGNVPGLFPIRSPGAGPPMLKISDAAVSAVE